MASRADQEDRSFRMTGREDTVRSGGEENYRDRVERDTTASRSSLLSSSAFWLSTLATDTMTPIRVRGKRDALKNEKWHAGKQRSVPLDAMVAKSTFQQPITPRKRSRRGRELSALEQLPTEILQYIFEVSSNINLPFASPELKEQLCSPHMYTRLTTRILEPVCGFQHGDHKAPKADLAVASRLLNCRFFTRTFLLNWLEEEGRYLGKLKDFGEDARRHPDYNAKERADRLLRNLRLSPGLLPPKRLLSGPWTEETLEFQELLCRLWSECSDNVFRIRRKNLVYIELGQEGMRLAVKEGCSRAIYNLLDFGIPADTEMLRLAITEGGWDENVVKALMDCRTGDIPWEANCHIDALDPQLWALAEKDRREGGRKGAKLIDQLKDLARFVENPLHNKCCEDCFPGLGDLRAARDAALALKRAQR